MNSIKIQYYYAPPSDNDGALHIQSIDLKRRQPRSRHLHILRIVAAAHADAADDLFVDGDGVAAEDDQAIVFDDAVAQGRVVFDEFM